MIYIQLQKATPGRRRKNKGLIERLQARTYRLPAHVTSEDEGARDVPHIKLSRAFAIVLGIHVIAIGGFMAFELFRHHEPAAAEEPGRAAAPAAPAPAHRPETASTVTPSSSRLTSSATSPRSVEPNLDDPANEGLQTYVVGPGETLSAIAAQFNVDDRLLAQKNGIGADRPFEAGMKLVIPNHQIIAQKPEDVKKLLADREKTPGPTAVDPRAGNPVSSADPAAATAKTTSPQSPPTIKKAEPPAAAPDLPVRKAEPVRASPIKPDAIKPNKDPKRVAAPPAKLAAAQASRLSSASAAGPSKSAAKRPAVAQEKTTARAPTAAAKPKQRTHKVTEGETAYRIARTYNVNVDQLIKANGIKPENLRPGTELVIPSGGR
jgi:LysM repeat protein